MEKIQVIPVIDIKNGKEVEAKVFLNYVLRRLSGKTVIYGGGVRDCRDLEALAFVGVNKVLVGSALQSGLIFDDPEFIDSFI